MARAVSASPSPPKARQAVAVHQHVIGRQRHGEQRAAHGEKSRMQDIERVDLGRIRPADPEAQRARRISPLKRVARLGAQDLGIGDPGDAPAAAAK